jgi:uncharacterized protein
MNTPNTRENKQLMQRIFDALATGDGQPFVDAMDEDFIWEIAGHSAWSRRWEGKAAVRRELFRPLFARFATTYTNRALRFIAEDEHVVVECRGDVLTHGGQAYRNTYCYVCRIEGGKLKHLVEYMDTEHAMQVLGAPADA